MIDFPVGENAVFAKNQLAYILDCLQRKEQVSSVWPAVGGMNLNSKIWLLLNRFFTGVGRCEWGLKPDLSCDCGAYIETMEHVINLCPMRSFREVLATLHSVSKCRTQMDTYVEFGSVIENYFNIITFYQHRYLVLQTTWAKRIHNRFFKSLQTCYPI